MEKQLAFYVSASYEMDPECELLGQLLAGLSKSVKWIIKRTPGRYERGNPDLEALRSSQFYLILLGMDIVAPIGVELTAARSADLTIFPYRSLSVLSSPAAAVFARDARLRWESYLTAQEFIERLEKALITQILQGSPGYGLELADLEELAERMQVIEKRGKERSGEERQGSPVAGGAGRGGVILPKS
jgi:hypothetical protein